MFYSKRKIQLSPRLRYGVGRGNSGNKLLKITGVLFLLIAIGLTLNTLGLLFSSDRPSDAAKPQVAGAQDDQSSQQASQFITYKVKKGDTLFNLGQQYDVDWTTLMVLNNLDNTTLKTGQELKIPTK